MCYDEGEWQAYLDEEVTPEKRAVMRDHLARCLACRRRLAGVKGSQEFVTGTLAAFLAAVPADGKIDISSRRKGVFFLQPMWKKLLVPVVAAAVLGGILSYRPARGLAGNLLGIFRVQNVQAISLTQQDMTQLNSLFTKGGQADIRNFGKIETSGRASWREVTLAAARTALGAPVKVPAAPAGYTAPTLRLSQPSSVTVTLDVNKINAYLTSLGDKTLLPAGLEGKPFTLSVPPILRMQYSPAGGGQPITVVEGRSPELAVPDGVDASSLRSALLDIPGLPTDLKAQLAAVNDWQHTLLIPSVNGRSTKVDVGGSAGVFVSEGRGGSDGARESGSTLIFEKNGIVYGVQGYLTQQEAVAIGSSLT